MIVNKKHKRAMKKSAFITRRNQLSIITSVFALSACASLFPSEQEAQPISTTVEQSSIQQPLQTEVERLTQQVSSLQQQINSLQSTIQSANIQQTNSAVISTPVISPIYNSNLNITPTEDYTNIPVIESNLIKDNAVVSRWGYKLATNISSVMVVNPSDFDVVANEPSNQQTSPVVTQKLSAFPSEEDKGRFIIQGEPVAKMLPTENTNKLMTALKVPQTMDDVKMGPTNLGESLMVYDDFIVFRVAFANGESKLNLSPTFKTQLLKAAQETKYIDIQGLTDSERSTKNSEHIAAERAQSARNFLVANNISESKISVSSKGAGGFYVENNSTEGKNKNRRVEIVAIGVDVEPFRKLAVNR